MKELQFCIPRLLPLQEIWKNFRFTNGEVESYRSPQDYADDIELLSCQMLYFAGYINFIAELLSSPNLSLMAMHLCRDCSLVFPRISTQLAQDGTPPKFSGRRLVLENSMIKLAGDSLDEILPFEDFNISISDFTSEVLEEINSFLQQDIDIETLIDVLCSDIAAAFIDTNNKFLNHHGVILP